MGVWMRCVRVRIGWRMSVKKVRNNREKTKKKLTDGHGWQTRVCRCVACRHFDMRMRCVWMDAMRVDENKYKEKEKEKRLTWSDASVWARWRADASWTWMTVKTKKKKRKEKLTGHRSWMWMVVDVDAG